MDKKWKKYIICELVVAQLPQKLKLTILSALHSGPENLKKVQAKKLMKSDKSKNFCELAFLAVLNFFLVQKLSFGHF